MAAILRKVQVLPTDLETAWEFFSSPRNLDRITPDGLKFEITNLDSEKMFPGQMIHYRIQILPMIWSVWVTEITLVEEGKRFVDDAKMVFLECGTRAFGMDLVWIQY